MRHACTVFALLAILTACGAEERPLAPSALPAAEAPAAEPAPEEEPNSETELPVLSAEHVMPVGEVTPTADGYHVDGALVIEGPEISQTFNDADLDVVVDEAGTILSVDGEGELPVNLTNDVSITPGTRATIGMLTGAEINGDPDLGIILEEDRRYFVFYLGVSTELAVSGDDGESEVLTLELPLGGQIVMILDPLDPFFYRFASGPPGEYGRGESSQGLIPFVPALPEPSLTVFDGDTIERGAMGIGFKVFDFFEIDGHRVVSKPSLGEIDWTDPLASDLTFRAGFNGTASFAFGILGIGVFDFELAQASGTLDVGLQRQHSAVALTIQPDISWLPAWIPISPDSQVNGLALVDGNGSFHLGLDGTWASTVPAAQLEGEMFIDNEGLTLSGSTISEGKSLGVSITFGDGVTVGRVEFPAEYSAAAAGFSTEALDEELAYVESRVADLENAVADYEIEVSLRGLRRVLPGAMNKAIAELDALPDTVYSRAHVRAREIMRDTCDTINLPWPFGKVTKCIDDYVNEWAVATQIASEARRNVEESIPEHRQVMVDLREAALSDDDPALRQALEDALTHAYDHRIYTKRVKGYYTFPVFGRRKVYDETHTRQVLPDDLATRILQARDNVYRIQETSDWMISARAVVDALPAREAIETVRDEVRAGLRDIPAIDGLGYRAEGDRYEAFVTANGVDHPVGFNVMSPSEVLSGVGDLFADLLLPN